MERMYGILKSPLIWFSQVPLLVLTISPWNWTDFLVEYQPIVFLRELLLKGLKYPLFLKYLG